MSMRRTLRIAGTALVVAGALLLVWVVVVWRWQDPFTALYTTCRIVVPRLGVNMVLVNGTDDSTLKKGPGRDLRTYMPGEGQLIYVAGHRTTYLAPFAHIDSLRARDLVTLEVPYGTFRYRVFRKKVVPSDDLAVLRSHGREMVALQACHPRFFATNRYIVWGRLVRIEPRGGRAFRPPSTTLAAAPLAAAQG